MGRYQVTDDRATAFRSLEQMVAYFDPFQVESLVPLSIAAECIDGWTESMRKYDSYDNPYLYPKAS